MVHLVITIVSARDLSLVKRNRKPNSFVRLTVEQAVYSTAVCKKSTEPVWGKDFLLTTNPPNMTDVGESSLLVFQVFHLQFKWSIFGEINLGIIMIKTNELLERWKVGENLILPLSVGSITIRARRADELSAAENLAGQAEEGIQRANIYGSSEVSNSLERVKMALDTLMHFGDTLSEVHPYVKFAWQVVSSAARVVQMQLELDKSIIDLSAAMKDAVSFVDSLADLEVTQPQLKSIIQAILRQTVECSLFIQSYTQQKDILVRALKHLFSTTDDKIKEFSLALKALRDSLISTIAVKVAIVSFRINYWTEAIHMNVLLKPTDMNWQFRPVCLPNTRLDDIPFIIDWVINANVDKSRILWVSGVAGSGKTTLATTIAKHFAEIRRLGAYIFFDRNEEEKRDPQKFLHTLAWNLGCFDDRIGHAVNDAIRDTQILSMKLAAQFDRLIRDPLDRMSDASAGPIVILIDALDECCPGVPKEDLLDLIANKFTSLPTFVRILIMSRPEPDIARIFTRNRYIFNHPLEVSAASGDVELFIKHRLLACDLEEIPPDWPDIKLVKALVERSGGLFIWADVACRWIKTGLHPEQRAAELVQSAIYANVEMGLDAMYATALVSGRPWHDPIFRKEFRAVMGIILVWEHPVSPQTIDNLLNIRSYAVTKELRSVLHCEGPADPVRILHISFREFLESRERCLKALRGVLEKKGLFDSTIEEFLQDQSHQGAAPWFMDVSNFRRKFDDARVKSIFQ